MGVISTVPDMTRDEVLEACTALPGAIEDYPFGDEAAVFKVGGKMFALVMLSGAPGSVNLKCDPDVALELRDRYEAVRPGYHMNKRHWNTVELDGSVESDELLGMIEDSYELVLATLPKKERASIVGSGPHDGGMAYP
jgi:predicted DNA-binding protein (MmcQ/YjbR family)